MVLTIDKVESAVVVNDLGSPLGEIAIPDVPRPNHPAANPDARAMSAVARRIGLMDEAVGMTGKSRRPIREVRRFESMASATGTTTLQFGEFLLDGE